MKKKEENIVFYLTKERQGLYLGNKKIKTIEEVKKNIKKGKQISLFEK